ncbi:hypothetical protein [Nocardia africana]|uniref:hypothetical protein n=1 Tax=Nocardia africana TaxID=134964 RepID=UPI001D142AB6|nr:hypothetical protein [Nocardia africana]MCC3316672.1 hypothetical protein [Nocardia africana]
MRAERCGDERHSIVEAWNGPGRRDGELTTVEPRHNAFHPAASSLAFEHWYFDAHIDSGHTVVGFLTKRRPEDFPHARPWVELIVYEPDGTRQVSRKYPRNQASFDARYCDVRIGNNRAYTEFRPVGCRRTTCDWPRTTWFSTALRQ